MWDIVKIVLDLAVDLGMLALIWLLWKKIEKNEK